MIIFHAYPIEWVQFGMATIAMVIHAVGFWDAMLTWNELRRSTLRDRSFLRILAWGGVRTAFLRWLQQCAIFVIGVIAILSAPPPLIFVAEHTTAHVEQISRNVTTLRSMLILVSVVSIVKELWAMYDRHRSLRSWQESNKRAIDRRSHE